MRFSRAAELGLFSAIVLASCGSGGPTPSAPPGTGPSTPGAPDASAAQNPSSLVVDQLGGPWRRSPIFVDDAHVAILSDACAAAARSQLGEVEANLPTAVVDARGERFATVIMADDLDGIECLARLDPTGASATVDSAVRLSKTAIAPVEGARITVASLVHLDDRTGGRTVAFGRIGTVPESAKVAFDDNTVVLATDANGWWATWWRGTDRASGYAAVDNHDIVIGSTPPFDGERTATVVRATWWLDPDAPAPTAASTTIHALVLEASCASGRSPEGRIEPPTIELTATAISIAIDIRHLPGGQDCPGNPPYPLAIKLGEPLGRRTLLDASSTPPRDASTVPSG